MSIQYNWTIILRNAIPAIIFLAIIYFMFNSPLRILLIPVATVATSLVTYAQNKEKENVYTAGALVFLAGILLELIKRISTF